MKMYRVDFRYRRRSIIGTVSSVEAKDGYGENRQNSGFSDGDNQI
jgi:hypothetical protein